jgi:ABC-type multidrug transport system fused ATPase/permease subunit
MNIKYRNLNHAFSLLPQKSFKKLLILCIFQLSVAFLDIVAILLLGLLSKSGLEFVQYGNAEIPLNLIRIFGIESLSFETQFSILSIVICILFGARTAVSIWGNRRILRFLGHQGTIASNSLLDKVLTSDPQYVVRRNSQEVLYSLTLGVDQLVLTFLGSLTLLATEIFFLAAILIVIFLMQPVTGICAFVIFGGSFYFIQKVTSDKGKNLSKNLGELSVRYNQDLLETLQIYRELVLRDCVSSATKSVREKRGESMLLRAQLLFLPTLSKFLFEFVLIFGGFAVGIAQLLLSDSLAAISSLVMFLASASRILPSIVRAQSALLAVKQSEGGSEITISQLLELEEIEKNRKVFNNQTRMDIDFIPEIKISNLRFSYENSKRFSLQDISLEIDAGSLVAIVGESGSGKTTLVDLVLGMNIPNSGSVEICGLDSLEAAKKWPGSIAYVPQNISVIDGSIRRNITLGNDDHVSDLAVWAALERAKLVDEVEAMPNKLDEIVGERGMKLSGGQRQRLGIARALFTDPKLIVFDEATSALDSITEKAVTEAIFRNNKREMTLIVIAHRLSTVMNADVVVLLENGRVVAKGTFNEVRQIAPKFDEQAKLANL